MILYMHERESERESVRETNMYLDKNIFNLNIYIFRTINNLHCTSNITLYTKQICTILYTHANNCTFNIVHTTINFMKMCTILYTYV